MFPLLHVFDRRVPASVRSRHHSGDGQVSNAAGPARQQGVLHRRGRWSGCAHLYRTDQSLVTYTRRPDARPVVRWRQRALEIALGMSLLVVAVPLYAAYLAFVEIPREWLRGWIWSVGRRSDALPGSDSEPARRAAVAALLQQATTLDTGTVARVGPGIDVVPNGDIELQVHDAPSDLRDAVRTVRSAASDAVVRRALAVAPEVVTSGPGGWENLYVTGLAWRRATVALEAAASAAFLGRALDQATRDRWDAAWRQLIEAHAATEA